MSESEVIPRILLWCFKIVVLSENLSSDLGE